MSIAGIVGSSIFQNTIAQQAQNKFQQIQSQFQKLGQDLQSGNLAQAQSDYSTLSQELPSGSKSSSSRTAQLHPRALQQPPAPIPFSRRSNRSARISSPEISPPRNRTSPRFSRARSKRKPPVRRITATIITAPATAATPIQTPARARRSPRSSRTSFARLGSAIRKSLVRAAGLRLIAIRSAAILAELHFHHLDAEFHVVIRNHRRQRHCINETTIRHQSRFNKGAAQSAPFSFRQRRIPKRTTQFPNPNALAHRLAPPHANST